MRDKAHNTTDPGYENRNGQAVIHNTGQPGTDFGQYVHELRCKPCGHVYGANGSDIHERKCSNCQGGRDGQRCDRWPGTGPDASEADIQLNIWEDHMPSWVCCDKHHKWGSCREAIIQLSKTGSLGTCQRCGKPVRYIIEHVYSNSGDSAEYELERAARLYPDTVAEKKGYDPALLRVRNRYTREKLVLPIFWSRGKNGAWKGGQFPPLFSIGEIRRLLKRLEKA